MRRPTLRGHAKLPQRTIDPGQTRFQCLENQTCIPYPTRYTEIVHQREPEANTHLNPAHVAPIFSHKETPP